MANNEGTLIIAPVRPPTTDDLFPSAYSNELLGGLHSVADTTERDAIIEERRQEGMMCYVVADEKVYQLVGGIENTDWAEFSADVSGLFKLDQSTPQNIVPATGTGVYFDSVDLLGEGALVLPRMNLFNSNSIGFVDNIGVLNKGLILQDDGDEPLLYFVGGNVLDGVGGLKYTVNDEEYETSSLRLTTNELNDYKSFIDFVEVDLDGNNVVVLNAGHYYDDDGETKKRITGLYTTGGMLIMPDPETGNQPLLGLMNSDGEVNVFTIDDSGLLSLGGVSALRDTADADTGIKEAFSATGKLVGTSTTGDKVGMVFKDGAATGFGASRRLGAVSGIIEEQGASWKGGLVFDVFAEPTGLTPQKAIQIKSNKNTEFFGGVSAPSLTIEDTTGADGWLMTLKNSGESGNFYRGINRFDKDILYLNQNIYGDGVIRVFDRDGVENAFINKVIATSPLTYGNYFTGSTIIGTSVYLNIANAEIPTGNGERMMWMKDKKAFRLGSLVGNPTYWDTANIGTDSYGIGVNVRATQLGSFAMGIGSTASGLYSFAMGVGANSTAETAYTFGRAITASAVDSMAYGSDFTNSVTGTVAIGKGSKAISFTETEANVLIKAKFDEDVEIVKNIKAAGYKTGTETGVTTTQTVVSDVRLYEDVPQMKKRTLTFTNGLLTTQGEESEWTDIPAEYEE